MSPDFEPRLIGYLCNWCSYAGADLCGVSRYQYPSNIRIVRVMCSTRIDPVHILEVFKEGIDGVMVGGCHPGDCHYLTGNYHTVYKVSLVEKLLEKVGIEKERMKLVWISASEGALFSKVIQEYTEQMKGLGPSPVKEDEGLKVRLQAAIDAASGAKLRTLAGKEYMVVEAGNAYGRKIPIKQMDRIVEKEVDLEFHRHLILRRMLTEPKSVKQLAKETGIPSHKVLECIISLRGENKVGDAGHEGMSPLYLALKAGGD